MEFFQSRHAKLFLIVLLILGAMTLGVMKQLQNNPPAPPAAEQQEEEVALGQQPKESQQPAANGETAATGESGQASNRDILETEGLELNEPSSETQALKDGLAAARNKNLKGAIRSFKIAAESQDKKVKKIALANLGDCYLQLNKEELVVDAFEKLLEIEEDPTVRKNAYEKLGETYKYNGELDKALSMYQESYNIDATPHNTLKICEIYETLHDASSIVTLLESYLKQNPGHKGYFGDYDHYMRESVVWNNIDVGNPKPENNTDSKSDSEPNSNSNPNPNPSENNQ